MCIRDLKACGELDLITGMDGYWVTDLIECTHSIGGKEENAFVVFQNTKED